MQFRLLLEVRCIFYDSNVFFHLLYVVHEFPTKIFFSLNLPFKKVGVSFRKSYSQISGGALCQIVHGIIAHNPRVGEKRVDSYLRTQKIIVQRQHIRDPLQSVDPLGSQRRLRRALNHKEYHVEHPNALWHVDSYHKLILWGIIIHGGINGYSRLVTYLVIATNNQAETAFRAFQTGVEEMVFPQEFVLIREEKMFKLLNL